jgi:cytochrome P450
LFGDRLATSDGALHRQRRRLVQPAFHQQRIADHTEAMRRHTDDLVASWKPGQQVAIDRVMHELTLRIVADALFSADLDSTSVAEVEQHVPIIMSGIASRMVTPKYLDRWPMPSDVRAGAKGDTLIRAVLARDSAAYRVLVD